MKAAAININEMSVRFICMSVVGCGGRGLFLAEGEEVVGKEVPQHHYQGGAYFGKPEVGVFVGEGEEVFEQGEYQGVEPQTNERYGEKLEVFHAYFLLLAAPGPAAVEYVVGGGGYGETQGVGHQISEAYNVAEKPGDAKVDSGARHTYDAEFKKSTYVC